MLATDRQTYGRTGTVNYFNSFAVEEPKLTYRVLEESGELGVPVGNVLGAAGQGIDTVPKS